MLLLPRRTCLIHSYCHLCTRLSKSPFHAPFMTRWVLLWNGFLSLAKCQICRWVQLVTGVYAINLANNKYIFKPSYVMMWRMLTFVNQNCYKSDLNSCKSWNKVDRSWLSYFVAQQWRAKIGRIANEFKMAIFQHDLKVAIGDWLLNVPLDLGHLLKFH